MAVVNKYGTGYKDPASLKQVEAVLAEATVRQINSLVSITTGDSTNSTHRIGSVPSNAIIAPDSRYDHEDTGLTQVDIGLAYPNGGAMIDADCLVAGDDISLAGSQTFAGHGTLTAANMNKRAWEIAGLAADPGGNLDIVLTQKAGTAGTKKIHFAIRYSK
ncbi:MAG TPA: hypothetical protein VNK91_06515 [Burkholderiaceae bacterium]|nr:hypothetical protein [Burkholderiaceae bacterium]